MSDWLKGLKVGDWIHLPDYYGGVGGGKLVRIDGETEVHWKCGNFAFSKSNGRIWGDSHRCVYQPSMALIENAPQILAMLEGILDSGVLSGYTKSHVEYLIKTAKEGKP